jgi:hypothetical protein
MKSMRNEACSGIWIAVMVAMILLGVTSITCAEVYLPNTFSPGTTISSSQVNNNFQVLAQSMPGMKSAFAGSVTLSTQWQNVASLTVTPTMDGNLLLLGSVGVTITQGSTAGGSSWGTSSANLCITQASGGGSPCTGGAYIMLDTVPLGSNAPVQPYSPRLTVPATIIGSVPVAKNTSVTLYLTASTESGSVGSIVIYGGLTAIFLPGGPLQ